MVKFLRMDYYVKWAINKWKFEIDPIESLIISIAGHITHPADAEADADDAEAVYNSSPVRDNIMAISLLTASHSGLYERALSLLDRVECDGDKNNTLVDVQVYTAAIDSCARANKFDNALDIVNRMQWRGV